MQFKFELKTHFPFSQWDSELCTPHNSVQCKIPCFCYTRNAQRPQYKPRVTAGFQRASVSVSCPVLPLCWILAWPFHDASCQDGQIQEGQNASTFSHCIEEGRCTCQHSLSYTSVKDLYSFHFWTLYLKYFIVGFFPTSCSTIFFAPDLVHSARLM